jgi:hypothetical protein
MVNLIHSNHPITLILLKRGVRSVKGLRTRRKSESFSWQHRNGADDRYSGVARNPNSYVPPAARKAPGGFAAAAARGATANTGPKVNGKPTPTGTPPASSTPAPPAAVPIATSASNNPALPATATPSDKLAPPPATPARTSSGGPIEGTAKKTSPLPEKLGLPAASAMAKTESKVCCLIIHICVC